MQQNMGSVDRIVRAILGVVLLALSLTGVISGVVGIVADGLAVVLLLTAALAFCPLYAPFRISTKKG